MRAASPPPSPRIKPRSGQAQATTPTCPRHATASSPATSPRHRLSRSSCPPPPLAPWPWPPSPDPPSPSPGPSSAVNTNSLSFSTARKGDAFLRMQPLPMRYAVCCSAKKDTVDKVCEIVKKQLALADDSEVSGASKFSELGADSLDTVEIVMGLEEEFKISVEESSAQDIKTVEDAAELIDKLIAANSS
ncbi:hypothetical protein ACP70R_000367 [Stipagrostis hirtigluma subsp. patula]